jgi:hypothetical protein
MTMELPIIELGTTMSVVKTVVCSIGFGLFAYWWRWNARQKTAGPVYICVMFIMLWLAWENGLEAYARYRYIWYGEDTIRYSLWWSTRVVPSLLPLCGLVWNLAAKAMHTWIEGKK